MSKNAVIARRFEIEHGSPRKKGGPRKDKRYSEDPEKEKARHAEWVKNNPEKLFAYQIREKYNLSIETFQRLLIQQSGRCAACFEPMTNPYIDHDHACCPKQSSCGKCIRGLLCQNCNTALGYVHDRISILQGLIEYLKCQEKPSGSPSSSYVDSIHR